jgi:hypothetical protein
VVAELGWPVTETIAQFEAERDHDIRAAFVCLPTLTLPTPGGRPLLAMVSGADASGSLGGLGTHCGFRDAGGCQEAGLPGCIHGSHWDSRPIGGDDQPRCRTWFAVQLNYNRASEGTRLSAKVQPPEACSALLLRLRTIPPSLGASNSIVSSGLPPFVSGRA